ncbi:ThiS, thiamine-biosynthesis [Candidatus Omnitrophus magneticus]|uniref:ThiS, thiamine-biosynthesis n=1 Tax=Candidatus Omnitrophus magneticus TaxID=1609969 RepID=A0A0F0CVJ2_9BACT|nr:ThiS, thiamine-biosynthesis [Candidatus Omnitrophus magneticus]
MKIKINGIEENIIREENLSLKKLLALKNLIPERVIVEYNCVIPAREKWDSIMIQEGDNIEIVQFVSGG